MPKPKNRLHMKRIDRVAFVDKGDNPEADVVIWKRAPEFSKALSYSEARQKMEAERATWQHTDILHSVIRSISDDEDMDAAAKTALMQQSIDEFAAEMKDAMTPMMKHEPGPVGRLIGAIGKALGWSDDQVSQITQEVGENDMPTAFDAKTLPTEAQAAFAELMKRATDAEAKVAELTPTPAPEPEIPAAVAKRLEDTEKRAKDAEDRIQKMETEARTAEFVRKAEGFTHLPIKPAELGVILRKIADGEKLTAEEATEHDRVMTAANEANRASKLFQEIGENGDPETSANAKVSKLAAEIRKADPKLSDAQARAQVYKENPALMGEVEDEDRQRAVARR